MCTAPEDTDVNTEGWLCVKARFNHVLCSGSGNGPAGGAAAGLGRGDPGWRSCCAMGKALVPRGPYGWHHRALPVSQSHCNMTLHTARCGVVPSLPLMKSVVK